MSFTVAIKFRETKGKRSPLRRRSVICEPNLAPDWLSEIKNIAALSSSAFFNLRSDSRVSCTSALTRLITLHKLNATS